MDRYWYHILLKSSAQHASKIEDRYKDEIPEIGLGKTISSASGNVKILGITMNSDRRLTAFYLAGLVILGLLFVALLFAEPTKKATAVEPQQSVAAPTPAAPATGPAVPASPKQGH